MKNLLAKEMYYYACNAEREREREREIIMIVHSQKFTMPLSDMNQISIGCSTFMRAFQLKQKKEGKEIILAQTDQKMYKRI